LVWLYFMLLLLLVAVGLVLCAFTLPGLWLMTAAAAGYSLITRPHDFIGIKTLIVLFVLSLIAEFVEVALTGAAAKQAGGGRGAMIGGVVGGILGGIFLTVVIPIPILGTIFGICLGSFIGAAGVELVGGGQTSHSLRVGVGAAKGRFMGIVSKLAFGGVMAVVIFFTGFP
jgi:uncharacterized protein